MPTLSPRAYRSTRTAALTLIAVAGMAVPAAAVPSFSPRTDYATPTRPTGTAAADLNGDGLLDVIVSTDTPDKVSILTNTGNGTLSGPVNIQIPGGSGAGAIAAGDFDRDGRIDLAVALQNSGSVVIIRNTTTGFVVGAPIPVGANPRNLKAADLDGDGDLDLVCANRDGGSVSVIRNSGAGAFTVSSIPVGGEPRDAVIGDFNRDGRPDLAVPNHATRTVQVFFNTGGAAFAAGPVLSVPSSNRPDGAAAGDFTGDGFADLAVTHDNNGVGFVALYTQTAPGVLSVSANLPTGGFNPSSVTIADLDADGDRDIAAANEDSANLSVFTNGGTGSFGAAALLAVGVHPERVIAADLDGPGCLPDLIVANRDSNSTSVILNTTPGGSPAPRADANHDGEVNANDISAYINAWYLDIVNGTIAADFDRSGETNANDIGAFLNEWYGSLSSTPGPC